MSGRQELDWIVRMPELETLTGLSRASIYRLIRHGSFPAGVELSANSRGWFASQVRAWQESLKPAEVRLQPETARNGAPASEPVAVEEIDR